jgi:competence protein ComEC
MTGAAATGPARSLDADPDPDGAALLAAVAAGTAAGRLAGGALAVVATAVALALASALLLGIWRRSGPEMRPSRPALLGPAQRRGLATLALLVATSAAVTAARAQASGAAVLPRLVDQGTVVVHGTVAGEPRPLPHGGWGIELAVDRVAGPGGGRAWRTRERAGLIVPAAQGRPAVGDRFVLRGGVRPAQGAAGPLGRRSPVELRRTDVLERDPGRSPVLAASERLRAGARRAALAHLPADRAGLLVGIALGDTSLLPGDVGAEFKAAGLTHLLAVSGANVGVVLAAGLWPLLAAGGGQRVTALAGVGLLAGFVVLTRWEPSVLRAAVMALLVLAGVAAGRGPGGRRALCLAAAALLLVDPGLSTSLGFALSVAATAGVLWLGPLAALALPPRVPERVRAAVGITIGAQAGAAPVLALTVGRASLAGLPANLAALPLAGPPMLLGLVAAVTAPVAPALAGLACRLAEPFLAALLGLAGWAAGLPAATVALSGPARAAPALLPASLVGVAWWRARAGGTGGR